MPRKDRITLNPIQYSEYRVTNTKYLLRVTLRVLFVGLTPGHFPLSGFVIHRRFRIALFFLIHWTSWIAFFSHVHFERLYFGWRPEFTKVAGFECADLRGADNRKELPPAANRNRLRSLQRAPPSMPLSPMSNSNETWPINYFACVLHPPSRSGPGEFHNYRCCMFILPSPLLIWVVKTSLISWKGML